MSISQMTIRMPRPEQETVPAASVELGDDLARLERQERAEVDRRKQEELARLRRVQSFD